MKSWLKFILKIIGGGFFSVLLYWWWLSLKDVIAFVIEGLPCEDLITIPFRILIQLFFLPAWDDWAFLFFALGSLFVLIVQLKVMLNTNKENIVKKLFLIIQILLLATTGFTINYEIQNELEIKETYAEFCQAVKSVNYELAYSYFSPQYRNETGVNRFKKEILDIASSSYTEGCGDEFYGTIWHRWNGARLYPFGYSNKACYLFLGGPELILVRIDGKWYFTGEHIWYAD